MYQDRHEGEDRDDAGDGYGCEAEGKNRQCAGDAHERVVEGVQAHRR